MTNGFAIRGLPGTLGSLTHWFYMQQSISPDSDSIPNVLPSRRERLRQLVRLKQERRFLIVGLAVLGMISAALFAALATGERGTSKVVPLGKGIAGVEKTAAAGMSGTSEQADTKATQTVSAMERHAGEGEASYYGAGFAGNPTASGERFDPEKLTAAHRTLPIGSKVRVRNVRTGRAVTVRINDRGPFHGRRVIDLSRAAARQLGMLRAGKARVKLALLLD